MHGCNCHRGLSVILLLLVWVVLALPVSSAQSTEPTADTLEVQDLAGLEEGLVKLTVGKLKQARRTFRDAEKAGRHPLAGVLAHLAEAYEIFESGKGPAHRPHTELGQAVESAKRDQPSQADYQALIRWTRDRLVTGQVSVGPEWVRILHCHLRLMKDAGLAEAPEPDWDSEPLPVGGRVPVPERLFDPPGPYTRETRRALIQGIIIVRGTIDSEGCTREIEVLKRLHPALDRNTRTALRWWVTRPSEVDGRPTAVKINWTVNYTLK